MESLNSLSFILLNWFAIISFQFDSHLNISLDLLFSGFYPLKFLVYYRHCFFKLMLSGYHCLRNMYPYFILLNYSFAIIRTSLFSATTHTDSNTFYPHQYFIGDHHQNLNMNSYLNFVNVYFNQINFGFCFTFKLFVDYWGELVHFVHY